MPRAVVAVMAGLLAAGCSLGSTKGVVPAESLPPSVMPTIPGYQVIEQTNLAKQFTEAGSQSLVQGGVVYVVRNGATVDGSVQVSLFKKGINSQDSSVQQGIEKNLDSAGGGFSTQHLGFVHLLEAEIGQTDVYLWFPPEHNVMELFVMRSGFAEAGQIVRLVIDHQLGLVAPTAPTAGGSS
jgi:hypothetical protein